jgi:hypothetical protein
MTGSGIRHGLPPASPGENEWEETTDGQKSRKEEDVGNDPDQEAVSREVRSAGENLVQSFPDTSDGHR